MPLMLSRLRLALVLLVTVSSIALTSAAWAQSDRSSPDASAASDTVDVEQPSLRAELLEMQASDQAIRQELIALMQESDGQPDMSTFLPLKTRMDSIDASHMDRVRDIIDRHGFPTPSMVGSDGVSATFLIIQHAPLETQEEMLPLVETSYQQGHLPGSSYAELVDRIRTRNGEPQLYGTQGSIQNGKLVLHAIADSADVDTRREELGMMPLDEYLDIMRTEYLGSEK